MSVGNAAQTDDVQSVPASGGTTRHLSPCTHKPDSAWVIQQGRNFLQHAADVDLPVEMVMRDNDVKYNA